METFSIGSPLVTLAAFAFAILLSFSSSVAQSRFTARNPPSSPSSPPPPPSSFHTPPPADKGGTLPRAPRPRKGIHEHRPHHHHHHHPPRPSDKKHAESAMKNNRGMNKGKLVGLLFAGIVFVLQIGVVGFLAYKRKQIYKV